MRTSTAILLLLAAAAAAPAAGADDGSPLPGDAATERVVYANDFEGTVGQEWSNRSVDVTPAGSRRFLGPFGNAAVSLALADLPAHVEAALELDLYVIRSWDGNDTIVGPDVFDVRVAQGQSLLHTTFANAGADDSNRQAYPDAHPGGSHPPYTGAAEVETLGYVYGGVGRSAVYRLAFRFPHSASTLGLTLSASGLEALANESWGIDNVQVAVDERAGARSPVALLVHGLMGNPDGDCPERPAAWSQQPRPEWRQTAELLEVAGFDVYLARYPTSWAYSAPIVEAAACLRRQIASVRPGQEGKVTLVAHSMGGVVGRAYIEGPAYAGDVDRLVTFGSPHLGLDWEAWLLLNPASPGQIACAWQPGLCDLLPDRMLLFNLGHRRPDGPEPAYTWVGGIGPQAYAPLPVLLDSYVIGSWRPDDDGRITAASALGVSLDVEAARRQVQDAHGPGYRISPLRPPGTAAVESYEHYQSGADGLRCLAEAVGFAAPGLGGRCDALVPDAVDAAHGPDADARSVLQAHDGARPHTPIVQAELAVGEHETVPIVIDGEEALVALGWSGPRPTRFALVTPHGMEVGPENVAERLPGSAHMDGETGAAPGTGDGPGGLAIYRLAGPPAGDWTVRLVGPDSGRSRFVLYAVLSSQVQLDAEAIPPVAPRAALVLVARLADGARPLDGGMLEARVVAKGAPEPFGLDPVGSGAYAAALVAPPEPGLYEVRIRARGGVDGTAFEREVVRILEVRRSACFLPSVGLSEPSR